LSAFAGIDERRFPVVEDLVGRELRSWNHGSVSQIKAFRRCPSLWYAEKVYGLTRPSTKATELGSKVHDELEAYLVEGRAPGAIGAAGLHRLPVPPIRRELVETFFALDDQELDGVFVVGKIDLVEPAARRITDHKTTSSFRYIKSAEELASDPQAILYVAIASPVFAGRSTATGETYTTPARDGRPEERYGVRRLDLDVLVETSFRHVYYRTPTGGAPASRESSVVLRPDDIRERYVESIRSPMLRMKELASEKPALADVPHDLSGCGAFGGCHLKTLCAGLGRRTLGAASSFFAVATEPAKKKKENAMNLLESLKKRREECASPSKKSADPFASAVRAAEKEEEPNKAEAVVSTRPKVNPPDGVPDGETYEAPKAEAKKSDPIVPASFAFVSDAFKGERLKSLKKDAFLVLFPELRDEIDRTGRTMPARDDEARKGHVFAVPDDSLKKLTRTALRDASEIAVEILSSDIPSAEELPATDIHDDLSNASQSEIAFSDSEAPTSDEKSAEASEVEEDPSPGLSVNEQLTERQNTLSDPEVTEEIVDEPIVLESEEPVDLSRRGLRALRTLYVDCAPRKTPGVVYLSELLAPLMKQAAETLNAVHFRVPKYKRGEDSVVALLANGLNNGTIALPDVLVVETRLPASAVCLEELLPRYDRIVERLGW
jgi:hypothetical protein